MFDIEEALDLSKINHLPVSINDLFFTNSLIGNLVLSLLEKMITNKNQNKITKL